MKTLNYVLAATIAVLAFLLLRTGCSEPKTVEVVKWRTVNLDSLKATMPPDTVLIPAKQVVKYVPIKVSTNDPRVIDSLVAAYREMELHYNGLANNLITGWNWDTDEVILDTRQHVYEDSVTTPGYFHRWLIEAEGPITSYTYGVQPICIPCPEVVPPTKKPHRFGVYVGGQTIPTGMRSVFALKYGYGPLNIQAGYLPAYSGQQRAGQVLVGVEIPLK